MAVDKLVVGRKYKLGKFAPTPTLDWDPAMEAYVGTIQTCIMGWGVAFPEPGALAALTRQKAQDEANAAKRKAREELENAAMETLNRRIEMARKAL